PGEVIQGHLSSLLPMWCSSLYIVVSNVVNSAAQVRYSVVNQPMIGLQGWRRPAAGPVLPAPRPDRDPRHPVQAGRVDRGRQDDAMLGLTNPGDRDLVHGGDAEQEVGRILGAGAGAVIAAGSMSVRPS